MEQSTVVSSLNYALTRSGGRQQGVTEDNTASECPWEDIFSSTQLTKDMAQAASFALYSIWPSTRPLSMILCHWWWSHSLVEEINMKFPSLVFDFNLTSNGIISITQPNPKDAINPMVDHPVMTFPLPLCPVIGVH